MGRSRNNKYLNWGHMFRDRGQITLDDFMYLREFFQKIGYDTSIPIYHQFCKKYGIEYSPNEERG